MVSGNKPDYSVMKSAPKGTKMERVGSAWKQMPKEGGDEYISIQLGVYNKETNSRVPAKLVGDEKLLLFKNKPYVPGANQSKL